MFLNLTVRCALFGDYVNQVNHFLASGYVEQSVVVIQLAKVKFFRGQVGLQNVMYATQMLFNLDIPEVVEFRQSMVEQGINGTQPLFIANEGKVVICGDTYPPIFQGLIGKKLLLKVDTKGVPHDTFYGTFRVTRICDDSTIIAMFELPNYDADDESSPKKEHGLHKSVPAGKADVGIKKESSDSFIKTEKDAGDCAGMLCKSPVLIDFLAEKQPVISVGSEFVGLIDGEHGKEEKTPSNDTLSDDLSAEIDILLSSTEKETQELLSHVLEAPSQNGEKLTHENHVVTSKSKRNLNPQFEEVAVDADGRGLKVAKVNGV
ncbi:uncharacterized protein LOC107489247 [Arachis duranensis]|uniref:Uncharacterized protein LOC107489247 n=1 Tax=Arachis duranensis TaxID=130453 RepID=A0A6P5NR13_ARADU|nr:uncharacterized protein LOC107489247 [Arachis duranensis]